MSDSDALQRLGVFLAEGLLGFAQFGPHEMAGTINQLVRGEPFLCTRETSAWIAQRLAEVDPGFPLEAVLACLEGGDCDTCTALDVADIAALDFDVPGLEEQP